MSVFPWVCLGITIGCMMVLLYYSRYPPFRM